MKTNGDLEGQLPLSGNRKILTQGLGYPWSHKIVMIDYFSHIPNLHLARYCIIFVGNVTELMFTVNGTPCTNVIFLWAKISKLEIAIKQRFKK